MCAVPVMSACSSSDGGGDGGTHSRDGSQPNVDSNGIFPADNDWNRDISGDDVDPSSDSYIAKMAPGTGMHADFSNIVDGNFGIPFVVVPGDQAKVAVVFTGAPTESDPGPYAIPLDAPIEGDGQGDAHIIAFDTSNHMLYELYLAKRAGAGFEAYSGATFDLASNALRTDGWTSADAAGLPIFPGLTRADEVVTKGAIKHALRFTMNNTQAAFVPPARHFASAKTDTNLPPMGLRVRLKASVDISKAGPQARIILTALKKYGMILADNGSDWYVSGSPDARWDDDDLHTMGKIKGSDFEVVKHGPIDKTRN